MQKLVLKETQAPYQIALNDALFAGEVTILEKDGKSVAAVVPMVKYDAFQAWRAAEERKQQVAQDEAAITRDTKPFNRCCLPCYNSTLVVSLPSTKVK